VNQEADAGDDRTMTQESGSRRNPSPHNGIGVHGHLHRPASPLEHDLLSDAMLRSGQQLNHRARA